MEYKNKIFFQQGAFKYGNWNHVLVIQFFRTKSLPRSIPRKKCIFILQFTLHLTQCNQYLLWLNIDRCTRKNHRCNLKNVFLIFCLFFISTFCLILLPNILFNFTYVDANTFYKILWIFCKLTKNEEVLLFVRVIVEPYYHYSNYRIKRINDFMSRHERC